jgi:hypothetical protein
MSTVQDRYQPTNSFSKFLRFGAGLRANRDWLLNDRVASRFGSQWVRDRASRERGCRATSGRRHPPADYRRRAAGARQVGGRLAPILKRALRRNLEFSTARAAFEKIVVTSAADTVEPTLFRFFNPTARALENISDARLIADEALLRIGSDCSGGNIGVLHQACFDTLSLSHFALRSSGPHAGMSTAQRAACSESICSGRLATSDFFGAIRVRTGPTPRFVSLIYFHALSPQSSQRWFTCVTHSRGAIRHTAADHASDAEGIGI